MSEVGMPGASREDEVIVVKFRVGRFNFFGRDVHGLHFGEDYLYVLGFAQHRAHRSRDVCR
jgi:hypothetical protein